MPTLLAVLNVFQAMESYCWIFLLPWLHITLWVVFFVGLGPSTASFTLLHIMHENCFKSLLVWDINSLRTGKRFQQGRDRGLCAPRRLQQ